MISITDDLRRIPFSTSPLWRNVEWWLKYIRGMDHSGIPFFMWNFSPHSSLKKERESPIPLSWTPPMLQLISYVS
jgi:hypothetical protein